MTTVFPYQMMKARNALTTAEDHKLVLNAVGRIGNVGAMYTTYKDILESNFEPDLDTYHILVDGCLTEGSRRGTKGAIYHIWRNLVKDAPVIQPDIGLMNKLIECCRICEDYERAFFFLSVLEDYSLHPNLETFTLLLRVSHHCLSSTCISLYQDGDLETSKSQPSF